MTAPEEWGAGVKELTIEEMLLSVLRSAEEDLRRNCIDGVEHLIDWCHYCRPEHIPPEVVEFFHRHFKPVSRRMLGPQFDDPGITSGRRVCHWTNACPSQGGVCASNDRAAECGHRG